MLPRPGQPLDLQAWPGPSGREWDEERDGGEGKDQPPFSIARAENRRVCQKNWTDKDAGCKVNVQRSVIFLYVSNDQLEDEV